MKNFTHLHVHTQYSILDGASSIPALIAKAKANKMKAIAITDHGNMFGAKVFHKTAMKEGIKPILGVEAYVARRSMAQKNEKIDRSGNHMIILAKNKVGYHNLIKLVSYSWIEGSYYKPRIDEELLFKHKEGLIISSACIGGKVPQAILNDDLDKAEEFALKYKTEFGDDFYLELQRHKTGDPEKDNDTLRLQNISNEALVKIGQKNNIKYIITNDVHFVNADDAAAHDILICLNTGKDKDDPTRMRYSGQEFFKTADEIAALFPEYPEAMETTMEIADKIEEYPLDSKPIMPDFPLPEGFTNEDDYLRHITYEGAHKRWGETLDEETIERVDFELETIKKMGFPGYFVIVWDFLVAAREMGVSVGPGRGSAAGSAVAYSLKITDIDPIKYKLLFERFLNPDRISMPDIDIDFDEDGREKVMEWVVEKYGQKRVAHIVTFGTMATKSSIRDVARVERLPLFEADRIAKMIPDKPGTNFKKAYKAVPELVAERDNGSDEIRHTLELAETLEGSVRQVGIHACGIIIGKEDLENYIPLCTNKEAKLYVTQYDGKHVEDVGLLKMDFLGLKTLSIIKDALENVQLSKGITVDIDNISLEDKATYDLYANGETTALFQFESAGMKKYLRGLKPNRFDDLIAMNALYRPGPLEYIPNFIDRKHGREPIHYDIPEMEEFLADTYGITVYQEQVMQLSQKLAGFTKGMADSLRKAMGKKIKAMMDDLKVKFVEGAAKNGHNEKAVLKVWKDWEAFAQYAFNKSHSTCYAYVSYQTAYLKAHYPAEFMAAVLSRNLSDIKKITIFMDECKRMKLDVKGPDVNESYSRFTVNKRGELRFGMSAVKGVGHAAVEHIIEDRDANGAFADIYDFVERVNLTTVSKKNIEGLALAGGFDGFGIKRHLFFLNTEKGITFIEEIVRYGNRMKEEKNAPQQSLFGDGGGDSGFDVQKPILPEGEEWSKLETLNKEKELIGIYLSAHPLDDYRFEINRLTNRTFSELNGDLTPFKEQEFKVAGMVSAVEHRTTKTGKPFGSITVEDFSDVYRFTMFSKDYLNFKQFFTVGYNIFIKGKIAGRFNNPDDLEPKIVSIVMLSDARENLTNSISLKIPIEKLSNELIGEIENIAETNSGTKLLKFLIYEPATKIWVQLKSKTRKIDISSDLVNRLDEMEEVEYKIN